MSYELCVFARNFWAVLIQKRMKSFCVLNSPYTFPEKKKKLFFMYIYKVYPAKSQAKVILSRYQDTPDHKDAVLPSSSFGEFMDTHEVSCAVHVLLRVTLY